MMATAPYARPARRLAGVCLSLGLTLGGVLAPTRAPAADAWTLEASTWARPRNARAVLSMAPLPAVVRAWSRQTGAELVVAYPGGEAGELWAGELRGWLVALGVPANAIVTIPGGEPGALRLEVRHFRISNRAE